MRQQLDECIASAFRLPQLQPNSDPTANWKDPPREVSEDHHQPHSLLPFLDNNVNQYWNQAHRLYKLLHRCVSSDPYSLTYHGQCAYPDLVIVNEIWEKAKDLYDQYTIAYFSHHGKNPQHPNASAFSDEPFGLLPDAPFRVIESNLEQNQSNWISINELQEGIDKLSEESSFTVLQNLRLHVDLRKVPRGALNDAGLSQLDLSSRIYRLYKQKMKLHQLAWKVNGTPQIKLPDAPRVLIQHFVNDFEGSCCSSGMCGVDFLHGASDCSSDSPRKRAARSSSTSSSGSSSTSSGSSSDVDMEVPKSKNPVPKLTYSESTSSSGSSSTASGSPSNGFASTAPSTAPSNSRSTSIADWWAQMQQHRSIDYNFGIRNVSIALSQTAYNADMYRLHCQRNTREWRILQAPPPPRPPPPSNQSTMYSVIISNWGPLGEELQSFDLTSHAAAYLKALFYSWLDQSFIVGQFFFFLGQFI